MMQGGTDHEGSDTDEDESSSPRAESTSGEEEDGDNEDVFYDATEMARSNSLQASRSGSMSLPAFEGDSACEGDRCSPTLLRIFARQSLAACCTGQCISHQWDSTGVYREDHCCVTCRSHRKRQFMHELALHGNSRAHCIWCNSHINRDSCAAKIFIWTFRGANNTTHKESTNGNSHFLLHSEGR